VGRRRMAGLVEELEAAQSKQPKDNTEDAELQRRFVSLRAGAASATEQARPVEWGLIGLALHFRQALESREASDSGDQNASESERAPDSGE
jgi:hypothetical protein